MLKKTLIAGGIAALMSSGVQAVPSFAFTQTVYSEEGTKQAIALASPTITVTLGANYAVDDLITIDMGQAHAAAYTPANSITVLKNCTQQDNSAVTAGSVAANNNGGTMTLGILTSDAAAGTATYRVTELTNTVAQNGAGNATECDKSTASTVDAFFTYTPTLLGSEVRASGGISGTYSATLSNGTTAIDGGPVAITTGTGATLKDKTAVITSQYSITAASNVKWNGQIDVAPAGGEPSRSVFTTATGEGANGGAVDTTAERSADTMTIAVADAAATRTNPVTVDAITVVVSGDFSWIDDTNAADVDTAATGIDQNSLAATCDGTAAASLVVNADAVTITCASADIGNVVLTLDAENNVGVTNPAVVQAMTAGSYTADVTITYTDLGTDLAGAGAVATNSVSLASGLDVGTTTLNGSTSTVQAYPVSDAITGFLWVTNTGTADAAMSVTAIADGSAMASCELGNVAAKSLTYVTAEVEACLAAASITSGRTQLVITVNAPASEVNVYAGYKVDADSDRLALTVD